MNLSIVKFKEKLETALIILGSQAVNGLNLVTEKRRLEIDKSRIRKLRKEKLL